MAFSKKTYTSGQTAITADNLNAIQDELIRVGGAGTLPVADYIVEQGTSNGWTYQKYASGYADLWWRGDVTVTSYTEFGGGSMVYTNIFNLTMPFGVTGNVVVTGAGDNLHIVCNTSWNFANKTVHFRLVRGGALKLGPQTVCLRVTGKWSTGQ